MKQKTKKLKNTISLMKMYCFSFWCNIGAKHEEDVNYEEWKESTKKQ